MSVPSWKIGLVLWIAVFFVGCGYTFVEKGGALPPDIKVVNISLFENKTREPGIENIFTNSLINEFIAKKRVSVTSSQKADATIKGVIKSFKLASISYQRDDIVQEYRATIALAVTLTRNSNGEIIWKDSILKP